MTMEEEPVSLYTHHIHLVYTKWRYLSQMLMIQAHFLIDDLNEGHPGAPEVTSSLLLVCCCNCLFVTVTSSLLFVVTHYWKELETWAWSHCACIVMTHRLIITVYFGRRVQLRVRSSRGLDSRSNGDLTFQGYHVYVSMHLDERRPNYAASKRYLRKPFLLKTDILTFRGLWGLNHPFKTT